MLHLPPRSKSSSHCDGTPGRLAFESKPRKATCKPFARRGVAITGGFLRGRNGGEAWPSAPAVAPGGWKPAHAYTICTSTPSSVPGCCFPSRSARAVSAFPLPSRLGVVGLLPQPTGVRWIKITEDWRRNQSVLAFFGFGGFGGFVPLKLENWFPAQPGRQRVQVEIAFCLLPLDALGHPLDLRLGKPGVHCTCTVLVPEHIHLEEVVTAKRWSRLGCLVLVSFTVSFTFHPRWLPQPSSHRRPRPQPPPTKS